MGLWLLFLCTPVSSPVLGTEEELKKARWDAVLWHSLSTLLVKTPSALHRSCWFGETNAWWNWATRRAGNMPSQTSCHHCLGTWKCSISTWMIWISGRVLWLNCLSFPLTRSTWLQFDCLSGWPLVMKSRPLITSISPLTLFGPLLPFSSSWLLPCGFWSRTQCSGMSPDSAHQPYSPLSVQRLPVLTHLQSCTEYVLRGERLCGDEWVFSAELAKGSHSSLSFTFTLPGCYALNLKRYFYLCQAST